MPDTVAERPVGTRGRVRAELAVGSALLAVWVVASLAAPWIAPYDPAALDFMAPLAAPSPAHWLGTDQLGRDVLSRVLHGGRDVLLVAPAASLVGTVSGAALGLAAVWGGRWVDEAIMRVLDAVMAAPLVVLAMLVLSLLGPGRGNVVLVVGFVFAPLVARTVRAAALPLVQAGYVEAARLRGEGAAVILAAEILPNIARVVLVEGTLRVGYAVFTAATLGFLGLGAQPPSPDWGLMVAENRAFLTTAPWTVLVPALAVALVVVGFSLVADGLSAGEER